MIAYKFVDHLGRKAWFRFWISFLIPVISLLILLFLPELEEEQKPDIHP